jgi:ribosomal protein S18 acetylase RimI-like enzyme
MAAEAEGLIRLEKAFIRPAVLMLTRAFQHDPFNEYAYPDAAEREAKIPYAYEFVLRYGIRYGEIYATSSRLEGIAGWLPSKYAFMPWWRMLLSGAFWPGLRMGIEAGRRMQRFDDFVEKKHRQLAPFPHWYLMVLGVDPEFQGKGYASRLLRGTLPRIDAEGLPCYLETYGERNVAIYQHFGFKTIDEFTIPGTTVSLCAMLREGRTA